MRRVHGVLLIYTVGFTWFLVQQAITRNTGWVLWVAIVLALWPVPVAIYEIRRDVGQRRRGVRR